MPVPKLNHKIWILLLSRFLQKKFQSIQLFKCPLTTQGKLFLSRFCVKPTYGTQEYKTCTDTALSRYQFTPWSSGASEIHFLCQEKFTFKASVGFESGTSQSAVEHPTTGSTCLSNLQVTYQCCILSSSCGRRKSLWNKHIGFMLANIVLMSSTGRKLPFLLSMVTRKWNVCKNINVWM